MLSHLVSRVLSIEQEQHSAQGLQRNGDGHRGRGVLHHADNLLVKVVIIIIFKNMVTLQIIT